MVSRRVLAAPTLLSVCMMLICGCGGDSGGPNGPADPACGLDIQSLAFGAVNVGESLDLTFNITNTGGGTLTGTVSEACSDFALVGDPDYSLGAGDTAKIAVRFSPTSAGAKACTLDTGASQCAGLPCSGTGVAVTPVCQLSTTLLNFEELMIGTSRDYTFTITNIGGGTLSGSVSESSDDYSIVSGGGDYNLAASQSVAVTIRFAPTSEGDKTCSVETGGSCPPVYCIGVGAAEPECELSVSSLDFGTVMIGAEKETTFTITNTGGWWLGGLLDVSCPDVSIVGDPEYWLGAEESATFTVRFAPSSAGPLECTILQDSDCCEDIPCTGEGVAGPICDVDPDTLDFGYLAEGGTADLTFTIRNTLGWALSGTVSSPCTEFSIVGSADYNLDQGESATFTVRFTPLDVGPAVCTIETGSDICTDVTATGGRAPQADYYVDASSGLDSNSGTLGAPFKTVTHAVSAAGPNKTIFVAAGTYDTALGEVFPIVLESGQSLLGDVANKGAGPAPTVIYGSGYAGDIPWSHTLAVLMAAEGSSIAGLTIDAPYVVSTFGIHITDATATITDNTFGSATVDLYGGVCATGSGTSNVKDSEFLTVSYGVYNDSHVGQMTVESNLFVTMAICIDIAGSSDSTLIRGNTFVGNGQNGMQVQDGSPVIENNTFIKPGGYAEYGAIACSGTPTVRGNVFTCARGVRIEYGSPDLGTAGDLGGNDLSGVTGAAIYHMGTSSVSAIGNTWASQPPVCGTDIVTTGSGSVTWGAGGETCP